MTFKLNKGTFTIMLVQSHSYKETHTVFSQWQAYSRHLVTIRLIHVVPIKYSKHLMWSDDERFKVSTQLWIHIYINI